MDIQSLVGLRLEACRFSRSSYTFEFSGTAEGRHVNLLLTTAFSVSFGEGSRIDVCADFSARVWPLLEREITAVRTDAAAFEVRFELGEEYVFTIWSNEPPADNLLLVQNLDSGEWFAVL